MTIVLGAGRQAEQLLDLMEWAGIRWRDCRLYDDAASAREKGLRGLAVLGTIEDGVRAALNEKCGTYVALGSRWGALRYMLRRGLSERGVPLPSVIHSSVAVSPTAEVGEGVTLFPGGVVGPRARVGRGVCFMSGCVLEHDSAVLENAYLAPGVTISGFCTVGEHCFLGTGSVITREVSVGAGSLVGAGATVVTALAEASIAVGTPAKTVGIVRPGMEAPTRDELEKALTSPLARLLKA